MTRFELLWHEQQAHYKCDKCGEHAVMMPETGGFYCFKCAIAAFGEEFLRWWYDRD